MKPNIRQSLVRFHLAQLEGGAAKLRGNIEQVEDSVQPGNAWREHAAEEAELFDYMAEHLRKLLLPPDREN